MAVTARKLKSLDPQIKKARHILLESVRNSATQRHQNRVWGQFLNSPQGTQIGIFGTASAAAALTLDTNDARLEFLASARRALPAWKGTTDSPFTSASQLSLTLKCALILDSVPPSLESEPPHEIEQILAEACLDNHGWAYFRDPQEQSMAEVFPTANVLLAASRSKQFQATYSSEYQGSVNWLAQRLREGANLRTLDSAFGLLALALNRDALPAGMVTSVVDPAMQAVVEDLSRTFLKKGRPDLLFEYYEHVHYESPDVLNEENAIKTLLANSGGTTNTEGVTGKSHKSRYMFYPVDTIVALALVESGHSGDHADYVFRVVKHLSERIGADGGYVAAPTQRQAVSDAYWVLRLLTRYLSALNSPAEVSTLLSKPFKYLANKWVRRAVVALILISVALLVVLGVTVPHNVGAVVIGTVGGVVVLPIFLWITPSSVLRD